MGSLYRKGSIYRGGSGSHSLYGGRNYGPPKAQKKHGGGNFLTRTLKDLETVAVKSPGGLVEAGKAVGHDIGLIYQGDYARHHDFKTPGLAKEQAKGIAQDLRHPLRHPGYTALDALTVASLGAGSVARVAAVGKAVGEGARAGEVGRAVLRGPKPGSLTLEAGGVKVTKGESRAALTRAYQRQINDLRNRFPEARIGFHSQYTRVGKALDKQRKVEYKLHTTPFTALRAAGRKISPHSPEGRALRAVAEGTTLEAVIKLARQDLKGAKSKTVRKRLNRQIKIAEAAKKYVRNVKTADGLVPRLTDTHLADLYEKTKFAALLEDERIADSGLASEEGLAQAIHNPGRVYKGASFEVPRVPIDPKSLHMGGKVFVAGSPLKATVVEINRAAKEATVRLYDRGSRSYSTHTVPFSDLDVEGRGRLVGAEGFKGGEFHVGQERRNKPFAINKQPQVGNTKAVGFSQPPPRLKHPLTGGSIHEGSLRHDVSRIVAENALESERHAALLRAREFFIEHGQDTPEGLKNPIPIRLDALKNKPFPSEVKDVQDLYRQSRQLNGNQTALLGLSYDTFRDRVFPKAAELQGEFPDIALEDIGPHQGVRWIDERLLGGLNKPSPLVGLHQWKGGRLALGFFDTVNNASRAAILYFKVSYAIPNAVGNAFLVLVQQGFAAPKNVAYAVRMSKRIGAEDTAIIDDLMGEGFATSLSADAGISQGAINWMARQWSKGVDVPFRRASFLYEAKRAGFKSKSQIHALLHDEAHHAKAVDVTERANRAIIDYSDLSPMERDIVRRVLFFYPWLKGSTKYAGEYLREHPSQAAFLTQLGKQGEAAQQAGLGDVPAFAEGLVRVGGTDQVPRVINPTSAGVLSQPAQLSAVARGFLSGGHVPGGQEVSSLFTPFLGAAGAATFGYDTFRHKAEEPNIETLGKQLYGGIPLQVLAERLRHDQHGRLYPLSKRDALIQYLLGGLGSKPVNRAKLNQYAREDQKPR